MKGGKHGKSTSFSGIKPDTDAICSAIAYAELKKLGMNAEPVRLGEISGETQFALDYFKVEGPRFVETVASRSGQRLF